MKEEAFEYCWPDFLVMQYSPRSVALHPGVLSEHEAVQLFTEVLNHVVTFRLAVDEVTLRETHVKVK
jgi:hypothetical protein